MGARTQGSRKVTDRLKLEMVGVTALALVLMLSLAGVWQVAGFDRFIASTYCQVSSVFGTDCPRGHR